VGLLSGETNMTTIERPMRQSAEAVLAEWRAAERERDELEPGSPDWLAADARVDELRHEYHDTVTLRMARDSDS
jgi:hypothetical protein